MNSEISQNLKKERLEVYQEKKDNVTENKLRQEDEKEKGKKVKTDDRQADREVVWRGNI